MLFVKKHKKKEQAPTKKSAPLIFILQKKEHTKTLLRSKNI
jgi:hypothetical protein